MLWFVTETHTLARWLQPSCSPGGPGAEPALFRGAQVPLQAPLIPGVYSLRNGDSASPHGKRSAALVSSANMRQREHPVLTSEPQATSASWGRGQGPWLRSAPPGGSLEAAGLPQRKQEAEPRAARAKTVPGVSEQKSRRQQSREPDPEPETRRVSPASGCGQEGRGRRWPCCPAPGSSREPGFRHPGSG